MKQFEYAVRLAEAEGGGFVVTCRDLPEVITQGESIDDALEQAVDAMDEAFAYRIAEGLEFPAPSPVRRGEYVVAPPAEMVAKAALYTAMRAVEITQVELARRLGVNEKEVRRMLDPRHRTKLARLGEAIRALGGRLVIGLDQKAA